MIRDCRQDQVFQLSGCTIRNDVRMRAQINEPLYVTPGHARRVGQHCRGSPNKLRREQCLPAPNETGNFTRFFPRGLHLEHVEQITDNTDEVVIWRLSYQPPKPVNTEVKIGG